MEASSIAFLAKVAKVPNDKLLDLIRESDESATEDALKEVIKNGAKSKAFAEMTEYDKKRVSELSKKNADDGFNSGADKRSKEILELLHNELGVQGNDINEIVASVKARVSQPHAVLGKEELDEDYIRRSPLFMETASKLKAKDEEYNAKITEIHDAYRRKDIALFVNEKALRILSSMSPIIPDDQEVKEHRLSVFAQSLRSRLGIEFDVTNDQQIIVTKNGKVYTDDHGNAISFEDVVAKQASLSFDFNRSTDRQSPGNNNANAFSNTLSSGMDIAAVMASKMPTSEKISYLQSRSNKQRTN